MAAQAPEVKRLKRTITVRRRLGKKLTAEERRYSRDLAKAIRRAVTRWGNIYRLPLWPVFIIESREPLESGNVRFPQAVAQIRLLDEANEIHIWYRETIKPEAVDRLIAHEMGHWVMKELWMLLFDILDEKDWKVAKRMMESTIENFVIAMLQPSKSEPHDPELEEEENGR